MWSTEFNLSQPHANILLPLKVSPWDLPEAATCRSLAFAKLISPQPVAICLFPILTGKETQIKMWETWLSSSSSLFCQACRWCQQSAYATGSLLSGEPARDYIEVTREQDTLRSQRIAISRLLEAEEADSEVCLKNVFKLLRHAAEEQKEGEQGGEKAYKL